MSFSQVQRLLLKSFNSLHSDRCSLFQSLGKLSLAHAFLYLLFDYIRNIGMRKVCKELNFKKPQTIDYTGEDFNPAHWGQVFIFMRFCLSKALIQHSMTSKRIF